MRFVYTNMKAGAWRSVGLQVAVLLGRPICWSVYVRVGHPQAVAAISLAHGEKYVVAQHAAPLFGQSLNRSRISGVFQRAINEANPELTPWFTSETSDVLANHNIHIDAVWFECNEDSPDLIDQALCYIRKFDAKHLAALVRNSHVNINHPVSVCMLQGCVRTIMDLQTILDRAGMAPRSSCCDVYTPRQMASAIDMCRSYYRAAAVCDMDSNDAVCCGEYAILSWITK